MPAGAARGVTLVNRVGVRMYVAVAAGGSPPPTSTWPTHRVRRSERTASRAGNGPRHWSAQERHQRQPDTYRRRRSTGGAPVTLATALPPNASGQGDRAFGEGFPAAPGACSSPAQQRIYPAIGGRDAHLRAPARYNGCSSPVPSRDPQRCAPQSPACHRSIRARAPPACSAPAKGITRSVARAQRGRDRLGARIGVELVHRLLNVGTYCLWRDKEESPQPPRSTCRQQGAAVSLALASSAPAASRRPSRPCRRARRRRRCRRQQPSRSPGEGY